MYFQSFPYTLYSLDDRVSIQLITNILTRVKFSDDVKTQYGVYDEYDIKDGETPELVADKFYNNPQLHWVIMLYNEILDGRFDWPLATNNLYRYVQGKYADPNGIHHYEDDDGNIVNGYLTVASASGFGNFANSDAIVNVTNTGTGVITEKVSDSTLYVTVSDGGFKAGDQIRLYSNSSITANITATTATSGTAVTNYIYEDTVNETKRRIKILNPKFVDSIIRDFKRSLET